MLSIAKLFTYVTTFFGEYHTHLQGLFYTLKIIDMFGVFDKVKTHLLSFDWSRTAEQISNIMLLIQPYL